MTLGTLVTQLAEAGVSERALAAMGDPSLLARVSAAAAAADMPIGEYAARSVRRFADHAGDEAWLALIGKCQSGGDPGLAALAYILETGLAAASTAPAPDHLRS